MAEEDGMFPIDTHIRRFLDRARAYASDSLAPIIDAANRGNPEMIEFVINFVNLAGRGEMRGIERLFGRFSIVIPQCLRTPATNATPMPAPAVETTAEPMQVSAETETSAAVPEGAPAVQRATEQAPAYEVKAAEIPLTPHEMRKLAMERAEKVREPERDEPGKIIEHIFDADGIRNASNVREKGDGDPTIQEKVEALLVEKMTSRIIRSLRPGRSDLYIPLPPSAEGFLDLIANKLSADQSVIDAWADSELWKNVLITLFTAILAEGIGTADGMDYSESRVREEAIFLKLQWFHCLDSLGMCIEDVGRACAAHYGEKDEERRLKIAAEYSRFDHTVRESIMNDPTSIRLLIKDMGELHLAQPGLNGEDFIRLLTPYVEPMNASEIMRLLKKDNPEVTEFQRFVARNVLAWHTGDPHELCSWLEGYIENNLKYTDMQTFCREILLLKRDGRRGKAVPSAFLAKLDEFAAKGVNTGRLIAVIDATFPGVLPARYTQPETTATAPAEQVAEISQAATEAPQSAETETAASEGAAAEQQAASEEALAEQPLLPGVSLDVAARAKIG